MWIYLILLVAFALLFIISRGFFRKSAAFIISHTRRNLHVDEQTLSVSLMIVFAALLLAAGATFAEKSEDTVSKGYIEKGSYGEDSRLEEVTVNADNEEFTFSLNVPGRRYTDSQVRTFLDEAEKELPSYIFRNVDEDHIDGDLSLVTSIPDNPVNISWITYKPDLLDYDGTLGDEIPEDGTTVRAEATLTLQEETRTLSYDFTIYPRSLDSREELIKEINSAVEASDDAGSQYLTLPSKVGEKTLTWSTSKGSTGYILLFLGIGAAFLFPMIKLQKISKEKDARQESMLRDYPDIIAKIVLLANAGAGMRSVFKRISLDYKKARSAGSPVRYGYEEISKTYNEMNLGISETDAYRHLGERCGISKYKSLSSILVQNLRRGSRELLSLLEKEAREAFEDRKKKARILGEEAGTKMLFPMLMMLGIVMIILMVPAFLTLL